jgi:hypothetical protein
LRFLRFRFHNTEKWKPLSPQVLAGKPGTLGTWSIEKQVPTHRQTHVLRKETIRKRRRDAQRHRDIVKSKS